MSLDILFRHGWNDRWAALFAPHADAGLAAGRVVRVERDRVSVITSTGEVSARAADLPAIGDWVALDPEYGVADVLPRSSALVRRDPERPVPQVLAANVDVVFVVAALDPVLNRRRLERTLAVAWESGATPVVVLTKPDRCDDVAGELAAAGQVALGVDTLVVSGLTGEGVDDLRRYLAGDRTAVLVGASGAGKSTLANLLLGDGRQATGNVRGVDRKGRHTTTSRRLEVVPGGGVLIDSPGLRAMAIWEVSEGLAATFSDIDELAAGCKFRDCRHQAEPGCAVSGRVDADRLRNWRYMSEEVDPAEQRRRAKVMEKSYRRSIKR